MADYSPPPDDCDIASPMGVPHYRGAIPLVVVALSAASLGWVPSPVGAQSSAAANRAVIGFYDGGQTEVAAGLELRADGRFRYALSYGALDEEAEGRWITKGDAVLLTSDPVTPARFVLVEKQDAPGSQLLLKLDLPDGLSGQYFSVALHFADGTVAEYQLTETGEFPETPSNATAISVTLLLPIADVNSEAIPLSRAHGNRLRVRFEPHDLGKVAFQQTTLRKDKGDLLLSRHDLTLRFRRIATHREQRHRQQDNRDN